VPPTPALQAVGVDEWAWRRGRRFGPILGNLADHRVVDLLPERSAASVAAWLAQHPTLSVVCRDRSERYANGMRQGAPQAVQVVDRFPLVHNLREAVKALLGTQRAALQTAAARTAQVLTPSGSPVPVTPMDSGAAPLFSDRAPASGSHTSAPPRLVGRHVRRDPRAARPGHAGGHHRSAARDQSPDGLCLHTSHDPAQPESPSVSAGRTGVATLHPLSAPPLARAWGRQCPALA
jgi:hypothetical protein